MSDTQISKRQLWILVAAVVLVNLYASGCAIHGLGPVAALRALLADPGFAVDFLLMGLGGYTVAVGLVGIVMLGIRLITGRPFKPEPFLVWSTAVNFFIVALMFSADA